MKKLSMEEFGEKEETKRVTVSFSQLTLQGQAPPMKCHTRHLSLDIYHHKNWLHEQAWLYEPAFQEIHINV